MDSFELVRLAKTQHVWLPIEFFGASLKPLPLTGSDQLPSFIQHDDRKTGKMANTHGSAVGGDPRKEPYQLVLVNPDGGLFTQIDKAD